MKVATLQCLPIRLLTLANCSILMEVELIDFCWFGMVLLTRTIYTIQ